MRRRSKQPGSTRAPEGVLRPDARPAAVLLECALLLCAVTACAVRAGSPDPASEGAAGAVSVRVQTDPHQPFVGSIEIRGLTIVTLRRLTHGPPAGRLPAEQSARSTVAVFSNWAVETHGDEAPPIPGRFLVETDCLRFVPRFPLRPGMTYHLRIDPTDADDGGEVRLVFQLPGVRAAARARVESIYPGSSILPENLHRITVDFSAPMSRHESRSYIRLERESGEVLHRPFLDTVLWNGAGDRLTLLLPTAAQDRSLAAPETPLHEGDRLQLIISSGWPDIDGLPLMEGAEKAFVVGAADRVAPDPAVWTLQVPEGHTRSAVRLLFPEPLARALLESAIVVRDELGLAVPGTVTIGAEERSWSFAPEAPWRPGIYRLEIEPIVEDLAGNNLQGLFDIEIGVTTPESRRDLVRLLFDIGSGDGAAGAGAPHRDATHDSSPRPSG